jgi:hypothetical protein
LNVKKPNMDKILNGMGREIYVEDSKEYDELSLKII